LERSKRLNRTQDIQRVRQKGRSFPHPYVVLTILEDAETEGEAKIAIIATKSVGGAVDRNQAKRMLREGIGPLLHSIRPNVQIVLIARKKILDCEVPVVNTVISTLLEKAGALVSEK
jgi:ribonuclease P protein component